MVAGLPLLAGSTTATFAQAGSAGTPDPQRHDHGPGADELLELIAREVARVHTRARTRGHVTGEDARLLAAQLRTLSVYTRHAGFDDRVRQRGRDLVRERGRDAIVSATPDPASVSAALERYGMALDRQLLDVFRLLDYAQRDRALSRILGEGASPLFADMAGTFERMAPRLDQAYVRFARAAARTQDDADYWAGYCAELEKQIADAAAFEVIACAGMLIPFVDIMVAPTCAAATGALLVLSGFYLVQC